ncbi:MAG: DUF362 domain-containing protein [Deltaproteobacteria bacterium]|nr:DUF362 domain-containing protein [Deltaproteobacteria bacterium]
MTKNKTPPKLKLDSINRRGFIRQVAGGAALLAAAGCLPHVDGEWEHCGGDGDCQGEVPEVPSPRSNLVVEVRDDLAVNTETLEVDASRVDAMVRAGLLALTGASDMAGAWAEIIPERQAGERVGFKVNCLNSWVPTRPELVVSLLDGLREAGADAADLFVWDRTERELEQCGFSVESMGADCLGTFVSGTDKSGPGYECESCCLTERNIYWTKLLTQETDHLINVAVMKNHLAAGFTGVLKNHYGSFSRPGDFHENCGEHIARLNALPAITGVSRLFVMDALIGVCNGDTDKPPDCIPKRMFFSFDPVAIDRRGLLLRDEMRQAVYELGPGAPADYLNLATELGIGAADYELQLIDLT